LKQPRVVGLPLDAALRILEEAGVRIAGVEKVGVPSDFRKRPEDGRRTLECVAGMRDSGNGIILITVSVPQTPKKRITDHKNT